MKRRLLAFAASVLFSFSARAQNATAAPPASTPAANPPAASANSTATAATPAAPAARGNAATPARGAARGGALPANPDLPTIWLVGDSTVRTGSGNGDGGQWGWGKPIADYFDPAKVNIVNRALGGTSSRTFYTGSWPAVVANIKKGDIVLIQFGHNDNNGVLTANGTGGAAGATRATLNGVGDETQDVPNARSGNTDVVHTFGWYLKQYVAETRAKGATPILCSLIPRKVWDADGRVTRHSDYYFDYGLWTSQAAKSEKVGFVDLNERIARKYDEMGPDAIEPMFADAHTHTSLAGAELNAAVVIAGLKALPENPTAAFFSAKAASVTPDDLSKPGPAPKPRANPAPANPTPAAPAAAAPAPASPAAAQK